MPPFRPLDPSDAAPLRLSILVCDGCDRVLQLDGSSSLGRAADGDPSDLAPHYEREAELRAVARAAAWREQESRWSCPSCLALAKT